MKFHFPKSIQSRIFLAYGSIFLLLILLTSGIYYSTSYHSFLESHTRTSRQLSKLVAGQISNYLDSVNNIQKRILESEDILAYIFNDAEKKDVLLDRAFRENIYRITGYDLDFYHMNIYNLENHTLLTFGQSYTYQDYTPAEAVTETLIQPALAQNGAIYLSSLEEQALYVPVKDTPTISMLRAFGRYSLTTPRAVIEMQISYDKIQEIIADTVLSYGNDSSQVFIYNHRNELLYPQEVSEEMSAHQSPPKTQLTASYSSQDFGITAMLLTPESYLVKNRRSFQVISLGICVVSLALLSVLTFKIAKSISAPLTALKNRISALELNHLPDETQAPLPKEGFSEVEVLNKAYNRMENRLKKSLDDIVASRTLTVHAQMMALQAQMDSHFLYNTLTVISIIAEENNDQQAALMCVKLTEMLRYVTEDCSKKTTLSGELHHCRNYSDLMSIRFGKKIDFVYDIDPKVLSIVVPRLIMQPVVENCVKYSRKEHCVLRISICAFLEEGQWKLIIRDNGSGFSDQVLLEIQNRIHDLDEEKEHPALSIGGMGLANIYLRMKLHYNHHFTFQLKNGMPEDVYPGAVISIGGPSHEYGTYDPHPDCGR